jgi:hypothetical protein
VARHSVAVDRRFRQAREAGEAGDVLHSRCGFKFVSVV